MKTIMFKVLFTVLFFSATCAYAENGQISPFSDNSFGSEKETLPPSKIFQEPQNNGGNTESSFDMFDKKLSATPPGPGDRPGSGDGIGQDGIPPALAITNGEWFILLLASGYFIVRLGFQSFRSKKSKRKFGDRQGDEFEY